jgi:hypothetical protein
LILGVALDLRVLGHGRLGSFLLAANPGNYALFFFFLFFFFSFSFLLYPYDIGTGPLFYLSF